MPALYVAADAASRSGQRRYTSAMATRLCLGLIAAICAAYSSTFMAGDVELVGLGAALAFLFALAIELWLIARRPDRAWFDGRTIAEATKTLTWRYAVGGTPLGLVDAGADTMFDAEMLDLGEEARESRIRCSDPHSERALLSRLRAEPLDVRRAIYIRDRVVDQQRWYSMRASRSADRAARWKVVLILGESGGVIVAMSKALGYLHVDLSGIASTAIGAGAAWLAVRQHESVARVYRFTADELGARAEHLQTVVDEHAWADEVANTENAICREHSMWRAARVTRRPNRGQPSDSPNARRAYRDLDPGGRRPIV